MNIPNMNTDNPLSLPIAVLRNGAYLWKQEQVDAVSSFSIVAYPRATREAQLKAEYEAMGKGEVQEDAPVSVVFEGTTRGRARGLSYKAAYKELSDGTFTAIVRDKQGNDLFPCSGKAENMNNIIAEAVAEYVDNAE